LSGSTEVTPDRHMKTYDYSRIAYELQFVVDVRQGKIESGKRVNTRQVVPHSPSSATHTTCMAGNDIRLE